MDRDHSSLIIILLGGILFVLGGILFVLLVGRDTAISVGRDVAIPVIGGALGVALVVGTLALFIGYIRRKRREGQPWLFHFILWPAYIGVLAVLGLAALHSSDNACGGPYECVGRIPLYWLPASLVLLSALLWWVEDFIIERRKSRLPAVSTGPRSSSSEHCGCLVPRSAEVPVWHGPQGRKSRVPGVRTPFHFQSPFQGRVSGGGFRPVGILRNHWLT